MVIDGKDLNASYSGPPKNQIVVHPDLIEFPDVALREFTHYVMGEIKPGFQWSNDIAGLESGLADYLPASFNGDPDFGKDIWPIFERNSGRESEPEPAARPFVLRGRARPRSSAQQRQCLGWCLVGAARRARPGRLRHLAHRRVEEF